MDFAAWHAAIKTQTAELHSQSARHRRFRKAGVGTRLASPIAQGCEGCTPEASAHHRSTATNQGRAQPCRNKIRQIVQPSRCPAKLTVTLVPVAHHAIQ